MSFNCVTVSFLALSSLDSVEDAGGFVVDDSGVVVSVVVSSGVVVSAGVVGGVDGFSDGFSSGGVDGFSDGFSSDGVDGFSDGGVDGSTGVDDYSSVDVSSVILTNAFTKSAGFGIFPLSTFS